MYCPDTLKRLNDKAVEDHMAETHTCEYCDNEATEILEIFNPADAVREPPVTGAYSTIARCQECIDNDSGMEDLFYCAGCSELFIRNHSWDVLSVIMDGEEFCQKCAAARLMPIPVVELYQSLEDGDLTVWTRINNVPGKELVWEGEYSDCSDFPGLTSLESVLRSIQSAFLGKSVGTLVYPIINHGYQFSVSLAVYR